MPVSVIGPLELPVAAGATNAPLLDPAIEGLLDYFAFWLNDALSAKLATLNGTSATAVPAANRFAFDPTDKRGHRARLPVPSLFLWQEGKSKRVEYTTVYKIRERELGLMYIAEELPSLASVELRTGLLAAIDATLHKASDREQHPSYGYNGAPPGTSIRVSLGGLDRFRFWYQESTEGRIGIGAPKGRKPDEEGRDYPALRGKVVIEERIDQDTPLDPTDLDGDTVVTINASDGSEDGFALLIDGRVPASDGTDPADPH